MQRLYMPVGHATSLHTSRKRIERQSRCTKKEQKHSKEQQWYFSAGTIDADRLRNIETVMNGATTSLASPIEATADSFAITFAPLSLEEVYAIADTPANGAIVVMSGMVRHQTDGKPVVALEYQAYEPMALQVFRQIATDIRTTWPDVSRVVIHHRTGRLQIGEISVLVAVGCPHRAEAFEACRYAIDTLKHNAPIWKKEWYSELDGKLSSSWVSIGACEQPGDNC